MDTPSFPNAPNATHEFREANTEQAPPDELSQDNENDRQELDEPSEYQVERHLTPGGEVEQIVHTQLDQKQRANILAAQQRFQEGHDEHGNTLDIDQDPDAGEEYDRFQNEPETQDQFRDRMREQFRDNAQREMDHER